VLTPNPPQQAVSLGIRGDFDPKTDRRPTLEWDPGEAAEWSQVYLRRNGAFFRSFWLKGQADWTPESDLPVGEYQWWVRTWNPDGYGPWAGPTNFSIELNLPEAATPLTPNGQIFNEYPTFKWIPGQGATHTGLFVVGPKRFSVWVEGESIDEWVARGGQEINRDGLFYGDYTWYLRTWNQDGYGPWSAGIPFFFGYPTGMSPTGIVTDPQPTFRWDYVSGATWYRIWISKDGAPFFSQWLKAFSDLADPANPSFTPPIELPQGSYRWYIRVYGPLKGSGVWSQAAEFERVVP
jgi:hypothetical protein